jgi:translation initiation factor IF-3
MTVRINDTIDCPDVRLIDEDGNSLGVMATSAAMALAKKRSLDLVEVNPAANPPVCKLLDYARFSK